MNFLIIFLFLILSVLLILVVLIQPGKGDMISGMGTLGGTFSSVLGTRKATDVLTRATIILASIIMIASILTNKFLVSSTEVINKPVIEGTDLPIGSQPNVPIQQDLEIAPPAEEGAAGTEEKSE